MKNNENTPFIDNVIEVLKKAVIEVEEFQVQAALGKAEAQDKFEEIKNKFNLFIHDSKSKIKVGKEKIDDIHTKFDELRVQLALGKVETKEAFNTQKKQLLLTLHDLEVKIKTNETLKNIYAYVLIEIEKFKVHLNTFEQRFNREKDEAKTSFEKGKQEFNRFIDNIKSKYTKKEVTKWEHFQDEVSEAFTHLKLAFAKP